MKVAVIGDTHLQEHILEGLLEELNQFDFLIHTGDLYYDFEYLMQHLEIQGVGVRGNCDVKGEEELLIDLAGKKIFICHGHRYGAKGSLNQLFYRGKELEADVVIFGHSHIPFCAQEEGLLLLNPGSVAYPRGGSKASYAILHLEEVPRAEFRYVSP